MSRLYYQRKGGITGLESEDHRDQSVVDECEPDTEWLRQAVGNRGNNQGTQRRAASWTDAGDKRERAGTEIDSPVGALLPAGTPPLRSRGWQFTGGEPVQAQAAIHCRSLSGTRNSYRAEMETKVR